MRILNSCLVK